MLLKTKHVNNSIQPQSRSTDEWNKAGSRARHLEKLFDAAQCVGSNDKTNYLHQCVLTSYVIIPVIIL